MKTTNRQNLSREDRVIAGIKPNTKAFTLSSGVVLMPKAISSMVMSDIIKKFPRPKPPKFFNQAIGREEENPFDPDYIASVEEADTERNLAVVDLFIVVGTELVEVPKGVQRPEDSDWRENLEALGIEFGTNKRKAYLMWVKNVAAPSNEDIALIMENVSRESGASEQDVSEALDNFRDKP